ncbi:amino acid ABC transporter permease [Thalassospira xiamenensis]|nr:amino acid ABC transporter permease [Thalassospira xiamenensis]
MVIQAATLGLVLATLLYLFSNSAQNLDRLGLSFGFDFLQTTAGFDISWSLIAYDPSMSYWRVFLVGIVNTLFLSFCVIVFGTILGTIVGILRLSPNPLVSQLARCYVEVVRNVPLLIQIIFWFTTVFSALPAPRSGYGFAGLVFLNNRGFYMPSAVTDISGWLIAAGSLILLGTLWFLLRGIRRQQRQNGSVSRSYRIAFALWGLVLCGMALIVGSSLRWSVPALQGFNIEGGMFLPSAFGAAFIAMTVYRSAAIAETVRAGMESISKGQHEAAATIGFSRFQTLRLILIPQAIRAIIPPLANSWLVATKDSSLAVAIGFPELVSVFMQTSVNQTGRAIEIIAMVMGFYIVVSLIISYLLNKYNAHMQFKAR